MLDLILFIHGSLFALLHALLVELAGSRLPLQVDEVCRYVLRRFYCVVKIFTEVT
jgi:hypothetical protein